MITFRCPCKSELSVPQDLAGGMIQCPDCKRLNDVPLVSELASLESDGVYKLEESEAAPQNQAALSRLTAAYSSELVDEFGETIDRRGTFAPPEEIALDPAPVRAAPRYDPITGELIEELEFAPVEAVPLATALPAAVMLKTRKMFDEPTRYELAALPMLLLRPINLLVMGFILFAHIISQGMVAAILTFYWTLTFFWLILHCLIIAHFANVVDETGPTDRQELPTPLRSLNFADDTFGPFFRATISLLICYLPGIVVLFSFSKLPVQIAVGMSLLLMLIGTVAFPAVALTSLTSGTVLNLRPDRLMSVARACGGEYLVILLTWNVGGACYAFGAIGVDLLGAGISPFGPSIPDWLRWHYVYAALIAGIYLLHLLGWQLGTLYRKHHAHFAWVLQGHDRGEEGPAEPTGFTVKQTRRNGRPVPVQPIAPAKNESQWPTIT